LKNWIKFTRNKYFFRKKHELEHMTRTKSTNLLAISIFLVLAAIIYGCTIIGTEDTSAKPRIIVTTDGETDDKASFLRFLLYTTDFDIEALIYTNSKWHPQGNGTQWMHDMIDEYAKVYPNLKIHHSDFPAPDYLKSKIYVGQLEEIGRASVGEGWDTPGSNRIVEVLLDDDARPVWLQAWGGLNNIAQALYRIKTSHPERRDQAFSKAYVYAIAEQDDLKDWVHEEVPEVKYILNQYQFWRVIAYAWDRLNPLADHEIYTEEWTARNVKNVSSFGSIYDRDKLEEGDTPAFLHVVNTGLRSYGSPSWGGWGGRFEKTGPGNLWIDAADDGDNTKPLWRFIIPIQEDFAARMQWTAVPNYEDANHAPVVKLAHAEDLKVKAGSNVKLDASPTYDPDDDELTFRWWVYAEAGNYGEPVEVQDARLPKAQLTVPADATGKTIHVICEVQDKADPPITRYRRVILSVE
jgi:hypothetical protein